MVAFFSFSSFPLAEALPFERKPKSGLTRQFVALPMRKLVSYRLWAKGFGLEGVLEVACPETARQSRLPIYEDEVWRRFITAGCSTGPVTTYGGSSAILTIILFISTALPRVTSKMTEPATLLAAYAAFFTKADGCGNDSSLIPILTASLLTDHASRSRSMHSRIRKWSDPSTTKERCV